MDTSNAPKALDHFRRGYDERSLLRDNHNEEKEYDRNSDPQLMMSKLNHYNHNHNHRQPYKGDGNARYSNSNNSSNKNGNYHHNNRSHSVVVPVLVDQICAAAASDGYNRVRDVMFEALEISRPSFQSGRSITSILAMCARRRRLGPAMMVWQWMDEAPGLQKNIFHYNALITCCEKMRNSDQALNLMKEMDQRGIEKNAITYSSAISACEKSGKWRLALG